MAAVDIVTLAEAKAFLNIGDATHDNELPAYITSASEMWVKRGGPGVSTEYTEWHDGGRPMIALNRYPVVSVTSVTEVSGTSSTTLTGADPGTSGGSDDYSIDKATGVMVRRSAGVATPFAGGFRNIKVVYNAGAATVPEDIKHAILLLVLHQWETQRGGTKRSKSNSDDYQPGITYSWPRRVEEILAAHVTPGIA